MRARWGSPGPAVVVKAITATARGVTAVPAAVVAAQATASFISAEPMAPQRTRPAVVIIPAHDESDRIGPTLQRLANQLRPGDRTIVVADHCSDDTQAIAQRMGCEVIARRSGRAGKGHALAEAVAGLDSDDPSIVVVLDADCWFAHGAFDRLVGTVERTQRPAQAAFLLRPPPDASLGQRLSSFAYEFRNRIRPTGWHRLGLPVPNFGSGCAFTVEQAKSTTFGGDEFGQDLQTSVELALQGHHTTFVAEAMVWSWTPPDDGAHDKQRQRWAMAHYRTLLTHAPRLIARGVSGRDIDQLALGLDLAVPPVTMLAAARAIATASTVVDPRSTPSARARSLALSSSLVLAIVLSSRRSLVLRRGDLRNALRWTVRRTLAAMRWSLEGGTTWQTARAAPSTRTFDRHAA